MLLESIQNIRSTALFHAEGKGRRAKRTRNGGPIIAITAIIAAVVVATGCAMLQEETLFHLPMSWSTSSRAFTVPFTAPADHPATNQDALMAGVKALDEQYPGKISLYAKNIDTGATFGVNHLERIPTASTIKLAVLVETFGQINERRCRWDEELVVSESNRAGGSGSLQSNRNGTRVPLRRAVELMISESDNTATNMLIDRLGGDSVNARMEALGLKETRLLCKIEGAGTTAAYKEEKNKGFGIGVTTPYEMVKLLQLIDDGEAARVSPTPFTSSPPGSSAANTGSANSTARNGATGDTPPAGTTASQASSWGQSGSFIQYAQLFDNSMFIADDMLSILKLDKEHDWIRDAVGMPIASKTGSLDELRAEGAIVDTPSGKIILFVACHGSPMDWSDESQGHVLIKQVAALVTANLDS